jgi:hypothetical protein
MGVALECLGPWVVDGPPEQRTAVLVGNGRNR